MPITYYNPDRPQQRQHEIFMQTMVNFAMMRAQQKARKDELEMETTAAEKMMGVRLQAEGLARPVRGSRKEQVEMAGVQPTTGTGTVGVQRPPERPDTTLGGQGLKFTPEGKTVTPLPLKDKKGKLIGYFSPKTGQAQYLPKTTAAASVLQEWSVWKAAPENRYKTWNQFYVESGRQRAAQQSNVQVNVGGKGGVKLAEKMSEALVTRHDEALNYQSKLNQLKPVKDILDSSDPMITGAGANPILAVAKGLAQLGLIDPGSTAAEAIRNTETYASQMGNQVAAIIQEFGAGTGLSDADREFAQKIAGGDITLDRASMQRITELYVTSTKFLIERHNKQVADVMKKPWAKDLPYSLHVELPAWTRTDEELERILREK